jgi:hypothetical protein
VLPGVHPEDLWRVDTEELTQLDKDPIPASTYGHKEQADK